MTEQNNAAPPTAPAPEGSPAQPPTAPAEVPQNPIARAMAFIERKQAGEQPNAAVENQQANAAAPASPLPGGQGGEGYTPTAADAVLAGMPIKPPEAPIQGNDPSLAKIVELDQRQQQREREIDAKIRAFEQQQHGAAKLFEAQKIMEAGGSGIDVLNKLGMTYEQLTAEYMKGPGANLQPVTEELSALKAELETTRAEHAKRIEDMEKAREAADQQAKLAEQARWAAETAAAVAANPERFGLLNDPVGQMLLGGRTVPQAVLQTMEAHWKQTGGENGGKVLTEIEAADMLQSSLERQLRQHADNATAVSRILQLSAPTVPNSMPPTAGQGTANGSPPPQLSTEAASTAVAGDPPPASLTADDYRRRGLELATRKASS